MSGGKNKGQSGTGIGMGKRLLGSRAIKLMASFGENEMGYDEVVLLWLSFTSLETAGRLV